MVDQEPAVSVRSAYKYYGGKKDKKIVLNHLNMTVERGSIYGLLGSSGCGKTTLLSCVVGRRKLMSGTIKVLPGAPPGTIAPRIGYMPQETALVGEFTVKDAVFFFGRIYGVNDDRIEERFNELNNLLELPDENKYIANCSGGQQRRCSFAAALVHEPELLILDEPTVGLDPVLRDKLWKHLVHLAKVRNVAVVITTHYIEEARQAQRIGLMRGGELLAEEAPDTLMRKFGCQTLEEAYLILSIKQSKDDGGTEEPVVVESSEPPPAEEVVVESSSHPKNHYDSKDDFSKMHAGSQDALSETEKEIIERNIKASYLRKKKLQALFIKNIHQFFRHPGGLFFSLFFPIIQLVAFFTAVGHDPREIHLAVVNDEVPNWRTCMNSTVKYAIYDPEEYTCSYQRLSCNFLNTIDTGTLVMEYHPTLEAGKMAVKEGRALAVMHIPQNFSEATTNRTSSGSDVPDEVINGSTINLWMDMSNHQLAYFLRKKLYDGFQEYSKNLFTECQYSPKLANIPILFNHPVYAEDNTSYTEFMSPGVMMTILYFLATTITSTIVITDRLEGVWDRTIVAGVGSAEILAVHVFIQTLVILVQTVEIMFITFIGYQIPYIGDITMVGILLFLQGIAGMCFGFFISVLCDHYTMAFFVSTGSFYPMIMLCGIVWPLEGMVPGVRAIASVLPFTIPIKSMRNIIAKGFSIANLEVYDGFIITFVWIIGLLGLCYAILRLKRK